jgi:ribosomal protein S30
VGYAIKPKKWLSLTKTRRVLCQTKKVKAKLRKARLAERTEHYTWSIVNIATGNTSMIIDFDSVLKMS